MHLETISWVRPGLDPCPHWHPHRWRCRGVHIHRCIRLPPAASLVYGRSDARAATLGREHARGCCVVSVLGSLWAPLACGVHGHSWQLPYIDICCQKIKIQILVGVDLSSDIFRIEQKQIRSHIIPHTVPGTYKKHLLVRVDIVFFWVLVLVTYTAHELAHLSPVAQALKTYADELSPMAQVLKACADELPPIAQASKACTDELPPIAQAGENMWIKLM